MNPAHLTLAAIAALAAAGARRRGSPARKFNAAQIVRKLNVKFDAPKIVRELDKLSPQPRPTPDPLAQQVARFGRAPIYGWLYDSLGRSYRVLYRVIATRLDGTGPVLASNLPRSLRGTPGYPRQLQARSLERAAERRKIDHIAKNLDPLRLLTPHVDPTVGAPVTWLSHGGDGTAAGTSYVVGGNGRAVALLMSSTATHARYDRIGRLLWPEIWPTRRAPPGTRYVLVRQVYPATCLRSAMDAPQSDPSCRLPFRAAVELAGATQMSLSARETPLGEALSVVRSLGLDPAGIAKEIPAFTWQGTVARDNVRAFMMDEGTAPLRTWLLSRMGMRAYDNWTSDPDSATKLFRSILIGFLPREVIIGGFGSQREEEALMAALPTLAQLSIKSAQRGVDPAWDLIPHLLDARLFADEVRGKSFKATMGEIRRMANQQTLRLKTASGQNLLVLSQRLTPLAILLGLTLKRGEQARDPSIPVERVLRRYQAASAQGPAPAALGLFGAPPPPDVELALGRALAEDYSGEGAEPIRVVTYQTVRNPGRLA